MKILDYQVSDELTRIIWNIKIRFIMVLVVSFTGQDESFQDDENMIWNYAIGKNFEDW